MSELWKNKATNIRCFILGYDLIALRLQYTHTHIHDERTVYTLSVHSTYTIEIMMAGLYATQNVYNNFGWFRIFTGFTWSWTDCNCVFLYFLEAIHFVGLERFFWARYLPLVCNRSNIEWGLSGQRHTQKPYQMFIFEHDQFSAACIHISRRKFDWNECRCVCVLFFPFFFFFFFSLLFSSINGISINISVCVFDLPI